MWVFNWCFAAWFTSKKKRPFYSSKIDTDEIVSVVLMIHFFFPGRTSKSEKHNTAGIFLNKYCKPDGVT